MNWFLSYLQQGQLESTSIKLNMLLLLIEMRSLNNVTYYMCEFSWGMSSLRNPDSIKDHFLPGATFTDIQCTHVERYL